ncbi:MAG TPA: 16S rRNA (guanine(966)-N(2))-methyltransferase RsmD [Thermoanaerobaculia bacterium]
MTRTPTLRIASGRWKRRPLEAPPSARPTSARARAALFDILQERIPGARLLELFAGSGAVGLEALSRGAARAVFVEREAAALRRNIERLGPDAANAEVVAAEAAGGISLLLSRAERFDIVFADPPYGSGPLGDLALRAGSLLADGGVVVIQSDAPAAIRVASEELSLTERRAYGRNVFWFFARKGAAQ